MDGYQFGNYLLLKKLTVGGMGEIFLAKRCGPEGFERLVVIKRLLPQFCSDPRSISILLNEARLAAQLRHPNIAQIYDLGKIGETYYICMEYVEGPNLRELIRTHQDKERHIPISIAVWIASKIFCALDYAHERAESGGELMNIVHQDVSPPNVLVSHEGEVKLIDFGLAKATLWGQENTLGILRGKFPYMSPEHVAGQPQDKRSDIYAGGIMLYELLTGEPPFKDKGSPLELLSDIRSLPPPDPRDLREDIPEELCRLLNDLLAKEPEDRIQSAQEVQQILDGTSHYQETSQRTLAQYIAEHAPISHHRPEIEDPTQEAPLPLRVEISDSYPGVPGTTTPPPRKGRRRRTTLLLILLLLLGGTLLGMILRPQESRDALVSLLGLVPPTTRDDAPPRPVIQRPVPKKLRLTSEPTEATVYLDGKKIADTTPILLNTITAAVPHVLSLERNGYDSWLYRFEIPAGEKGIREVHAALTPKPASFTLHFSPSPLQVTWEGTSWFQTTPLTLSGIQPGEAKTLILSAEGYGPKEIPVQLEAGEKKVLSVNLDPLLAWLTLLSQPDGARVFLDGQDVGGKTPVYSFQCEANKPYKVRFQKDGYSGWSTTVTTRVGTTQTLEAQLDPLQGGLRVDSTPWTEVYLDDELLGNTPFLSKTIPAGTHELKLIRRDRGIERRESLEIPPGDIVKRRFSFTGTLDVSGVPDGVEILLDGKPLGPAPLAPMTLPAGNYKLTFRDVKSRTEGRMEVRITPDQPFRVELPKQ